MKVLVNQSAIEYEVQGEGEPVLLLHGWGRNLHDFDSLARVLSTDHKVVRLDLPGFGNSEMIKGSTILDYALFVKSFLEKIEVNPKYYVGHSFGGRILLKGLGKEILPTPNKIVLIASAGVRIFDVVKSVLLIASKIGRAILYLPPFIFFKSQIERLWRRTLKADYHASGKMKEVFKAAVGEDLRGFAVNIKAPTLLIWGRGDVVTPLKEGEILHSLISDSEIKVFENAGHFVFKEEESEVNELIKNYFK
jgi:pimeloyl-ACP methyl ester carboxylesterase